MADPKEKSSRDERPDARRSLERDMDRLERREPSAASFWRSLSVLGIVGWTIALPAVLGALLGHRIDIHLESGVRFTLMLLVLGVVLGSAIAWRVVGEHRK